MGAHQKPLKKSTCIGQKRRTQTKTQKCRSEIHKTRRKNFQIGKGYIQQQIQNIPPCRPQHTQRQISLSLSLSLPLYVFFSWSVFLRTLYLSIYKLSLSLSLDLSVCALCVRDDADPRQSRVRRRRKPGGQHRSAKACGKQTKQSLRRGAETGAKRREANFRQKNQIGERP